VPFVALGGCRHMYRPAGSQAHSRPGDVEGAANETAWRRGGERRVMEGTAADRTTCRRAGERAGDAGPTPNRTACRRPSTTGRDMEGRRRIWTAGVRRDASPVRTGGGVVDGRLGGVVWTSDSGGCNSSLAARLGVRTRGGVLDSSLAAGLEVASWAGALGRWVGSWTGMCFLVLV
jgi:hypothetical protein